MQIGFIYSRWYRFYKSLFPSFPFCKLFVPAQSIRTVYLHSILHDIQFRMISFLLFLINLRTSRFSISIHFKFQCKGCIKIFLLKIAASSLKRSDVTVCFDFELYILPRRSVYLYCILSWLWQFARVERSQMSFYSSTLEQRWMYNVGGSSWH